MIPRRPLLMLIALVLALHVLVLAGASAHSVRPGPGAAPQAFQTRTIALAAPAPSAAPAPAMAPPRSAPRLPPPRAERRPHPRQAAEAAPRTGASPAAPPVEWSLPSEAELRALNATDSSPAALAAGAGEAASESSDHAGQRSATLVADAGGAALVAAGPAVAAEPAQPPAISGAPVQLPPPAKLDFEVTGQAKGFGYHASAELVWEHDATSYRAHQEIKVIFLGSRSQDSVGSVTAHGLQPRRFGDRSRSERAAHFDFAAGRVTFSANTPAAPIEPGAQDRLSVFLQLASMLAGAPERYPVGTQIEMTTVSARAADVWTFTVQPEQSLELPVGTLRAVPLQRLPRREYDQKAQVWLAPSLGYLPVRIRLTEANGDFAELNLQGHGEP